MKIGKIYLLTNKINGKQYVGQTISKNSYGHGTAIQHAFNKYGKDSFNVDIIEDCVPYEKLDELEVKYIRDYNTISPNGYNLEFGGNPGKIISEESKKKISKSCKGRIPWNKGKKQADDQKLAHSQKMKGRTPWNKGKKASKEAKEKMSAAAKNRNDLERNEKGQFIKVLG